MYGHPNKKVLDNLKDSKIYRTYEDGSIMFKIKNNKLKIKLVDNKSKILYNITGDRMKDYNTRKAINVPEDENVIMVTMGACKVLIDSKNDHLLTYGLGPCVGVSVVMKHNNGKVSRLLAHVDMGQIIGITLDDLQSYFRRMKNSAGNDIVRIEISLSSTQSYRNIKYLNQKETELLAIIIREFKEYGVSIENIKFNYSSQVQISPDGIISTYSEYELEQHQQNMMNEALRDFGGDVHPELNIYITNFGAYMGNCSLGLDCTDQEKQNVLSRDYWKKYIDKGYNLIVAPSFNDPQRQAVYVANWQEVIDPKWGVVVGCPIAQATGSFGHGVRKF